MSKLLDETWILLNNFSISTSLKVLCEATFKCSRSTDSGLHFCNIWKNPVALNPGCKRKKRLQISRSSFFWSSSAQSVCRWNSPSLILLSHLSHSRAGRHSRTCSLYWAYGIGSWQWLQRSWNFSRNIVMVRARPPVKLALRQRGHLSDWLCVVVKQDWHMWPWQQGCKFPRN